VFSGMSPNSLICGKWTRSAAGAFGNSKEAVSRALRRPLLPIAAVGPANGTDSCSRRVRRAGPYARAMAAPWTDSAGSRIRWLAAASGCSVSWVPAMSRT
jgi:hypothetical protein